VGKRKKERTNDMGVYLDVDELEESRRVCCGVDEGPGVDAASAAQELEDEDEEEAGDTANIFGGNGRAKMNERKATCSLGA
jgi:hypothetical protein